MTKSVPYASALTGDEITSVHETVRGIAVAWVTVTGRFGSSAPASALCADVAAPASSPVRASLWPAKFPGRPRCPRSKVR